MADTGKIITLAKAMGITPSQVRQEIAQLLPDEVDDWLESHITNPDSPPLDRSLTSSVSATPADITGDLKSAFEEFGHEVYCELYKITATDSTHGRMQLALDVGQELFVQNNGTAAATVYLYDENDTQIQTISTNLKANKRVTVTVTASGAAKIGGYCSAGYNVSVYVINKESEIVRLDDESKKMGEKFDFSMPLASDGVFELSDADFEQGTYNNGNPADSDYRIRTKHIKALGDISVTVAPGTTCSYIKAIVWAKNDKTIIYNGNYLSTKQTINIDSYCSIAFICRNGDGTSDIAIAPNDYDATITFVTQLKTEIDSIASDVSDIENHIVPFDYSMPLALDGMLNLSDANFEQGTYINGNPDDSDYRIRTKHFKALGDIIVNVNPGTKCSYVKIIIWQKNDKTIDYNGLYSSEAQTVTVAKDKSIAFICRDGDGTVDNNIAPSDYDATITFESHVSSASGQNGMITVMTYNTGNFSGVGYTSGSEELAIQYRRAIGEVESDICFFQDDVQFYNNTDETLPKDEIFGMFKHYYRPGNSSYNYIGWASELPISDIVAVTLEHSTGGHPKFYVGKTKVNGITVNLINVHFTWTDVTLRHAQIQEVINYISNNNLEYVIVAGDMNPSTRVNSEFPPGSSATHNYSNIDEDYAIWENAGFTVCNAGYFGNYATDMIYLNADDGGAKAAWDNIIVSSNIIVRNVGSVQKAYMDDHAIFWAALMIV